MATYYLSPTGDDTTGSGTVSSPWFTIDKAWDSVSAGDIVIMKGGDYYYDTTQVITGVSGSSGNSITLKNYPGEQPHIIKPESWTYVGWYYGLYIHDCDYIDVIGIELSGFVYEQISPCRAIMAEDVNYCNFKNLSCHDNELGMVLRGTSTGNLVLNCDFYDNYDPYSTIPYGNADGLSISEIDASTTNTIRNCRAWYNSDDGFDCWGTEGIVIFDNCWAWKNGYREDHTTVGGDGNGFKLGQIATTIDSTRRYLYHCISAENNYAGFSQNTVDPYVLTCELYNCTSYGNVTYAGYQFNWAAEGAGTNSILRNNISYNDYATYYGDTWIAEDHNSWDSGFSVGSIDFVSSYADQLSSDRRSDGSLPYVNFCRLQYYSDLIDAGVNVSLSYKGTAPDLGAWEYLTAYYVSSGGNDSNDGGSDSVAWATLDKVNNEWLAGNFAPGDVILLHKGDTFSGYITVSESGTEEKPIVISSYGTGNDPIVSGFSQLGSWSVYSGSIYQATTSSAADTNMVLVDGTQVHMGRYPNYGTELQIDSSDTNVSITDNDLPDSPDWTGAELVLNKVEWITDRGLITNHDTGGVLTYSTYGTNYYCYNSQYYFIQNDIRCVTEEDEWYHDNSSNTFYIYSNPSGKEVLIASENYLLYNYNYNYIIVDGIHFKGSIEDCIYMYSAENCIVENCTIEYAGRSGVCFYGGDSNTTDYNTISYTNGCGIENISGDTVTITRNIISNIGLLIGQFKRGLSSGYQYTTSSPQAIYINTANGSTNFISNNNISNIALNGIIGSSATPFVAEKNYAEYCCQVLGDGGGFYLAGGTQNRTINKNIIVYSGVGANSYVDIARGIYCDAQASNVTVTNNTVGSCTEAGYHFHSSSNSVVNNNLSYDNEFQVWFQYTVAPGTNNTITYNKFICKSLSQRSLYIYGYTEAQILNLGAFDYNYYARPIDDDDVMLYLSANHTLSEWQTLVNPDDANSDGSPTSISTEDDLHFLYNNSDIDNYYTVSAPMVDVENNSYTSLVTVEPWGSIVLIGTGSVTPGAPVYTDAFIPHPNILHVGII